MSLKQLLQRIDNSIRLLFSKRERELAEGYRQMAADAEHEAEALEWIEGLIGDVGDESR
jgi:hypothetical protein